MNRNEDGSSGADGLYILALIKELVEEANKTENYNEECDAWPFHRKK